MKKKLLGMFTALFLCALLLPAAARATDSALAVLYNDGSLVFQDDDTPQDGKTVRQTYTVDLTARDTPESAPPWHDERQAVFVVDFAAPVRPSSTRNWFSGFVNLESVHNVQNLDTSADTDMSGMFDGCGSLRELDLSGFDTASVTDMSGMFRDCTRLTALSLHAFDTSLVADMSAMFQSCTALTQTDLSNFSADSLENTASMFENCLNLRRIYASGRFDASSVQSGDDMFTGCLSLLGGNGTRFDRAHTGKAYARLDAADAPGYFSIKSTPAPTPVSGDVYAILYDDDTLVFQHGDTPESGRTVRQTYSVDLERAYGPRLTTSPSEVPWYDARESVRVVSFADTIRPTATQNWFRDFASLERVENGQNLDTSRLTNMYHMFSGCSSLQTVDVSSWDTSRVTDMCCVFYKCRNLTALDVSGWDTYNVTDIRSLFFECGSLTELDLSGWDTSHVLQMLYMFKDCSGLTELDLSGFNTRNVTEIHDMFRGCSNLRTIYASGGFSIPANVYSDDMFDGCTSLVGGNGTAYDSARVDAEYARLDTADAPGYFSSRNPIVYYTVTWKNDDETVLQTEEVLFGATPSYNGDAPIKTGYAFAGWEPEPAPVSADTTYTARFVPAVCTVTWADEDGTVLQTGEVASGTTPSYSGETPAKPDHIFAGWEPEPAPVFADTTYTARFRRVAQPFDVTRDAYSFGNSRRDFGYGTRQSPISPNSFFVIFGDTMLGRLQYTRMTANEWSGNCAGMAGSAALFHADESISPADFGKETVWALEIGDSNDEITVLAFIEAMQAAQYTEAFAQARHDHAFRPGDSLIPLAGAVRDAAELGLPTLIAITRDGVGGHALLAFGVEDETDTGAQLKIYDCNHPGELQRLTIQDTSGWAYDMGDYGVWGGEGCSISYVPFETLESIWEHRGSPRATHETLTVNAGNLSITNALNEEVASLVDGRLVTSRDDVYEMPELSMYWPQERTIFLPKGLYTLTSEDDADLTATMTDQHMSASITTSASTVSFDVDDGYMLNTVAVVDAAGTDTYSVTLAADFEDMLCQTVSLEGTGQGRTLEISMNPDGTPFVSNGGVASLTIDDVPQTTYTIAVSAGEGGTVTPAGDATVPAGSDQTFTFTPDAGYIVRSVMLDDAEIGPRTGYTFRNVLGNHALSVLFEQAPLSAVRDGNALRVTVANPDRQTVAVSYFDEAGKFLSADLRPAAASLTFPLAAAHTARVVLLDDACRPLCAPVPVTLT